MTRKRIKLSGRVTDTATLHQLRIARDTLRMNDAMARVMGGPTKEEARDILRAHGEDPARYEQNPPLIAVKPIGSNMTEVQHGEWLVLYSYTTPVAAVRGGLDYDMVRTEKFWSNTTSRHISKWMKMHGFYTSRKVTQAQMEAIARGDDQRPDKGFSKNPGGVVVRIRRTPYGEWRVPGPDKTEAQAYYTDDKQDAIDTAVDMYKRAGIVDINVQFGGGRPAYVARQVHASNPKQRHSASDRPMGRIGSVSEGTLRPEDLISTFASELKSIYRGHKMPKLVRQMVEEAELVAEAESVGSEWPLDENDLLGALIDELNDVAPEYTYFGTAEGDGASFGFWPSWDAINEGVHDKYILKVDDLSRVPKGYVGIVLETNDHGNATMYSWTRGKGHELWSVV